MKRVVSLIFAVVLMAAVFPLGGARAADEKLTIELKAQNGSGQDGTATITKLSDTMVRVEIQLKNGTAVVQPAHIHKGTCANLDPKPAYPLTNVVNGASETEVSADIENLANQGYAINVHKSAAEVGTYTSCGEIHEMMVGGTIGGTTAPAGSMEALKNLQNATHDLVRETSNKDAPGSQAAYDAYHTLFAANEGAIAAKSAATQAKLEDLMHQVRDSITAADWAKASAAATQLETAVGDAVTMMGGTSSVSGTTGTAGSMDAMKNLQSAAQDLIRETTNKDAPGSQAAYDAYHTLFAANEDAIKAKSAATQAKLEDLMHQVRDSITAADWAKASAAANQLEEAVGSAMTMMGSSTSGSTSGGAMSGGATSGSSLPTTGNDTLLPFAAGLALLAAGLLSAGAQLRRRA